MVSVMEVALSRRRSGSGECIEDEVSVRVFIKLTKQPSGAPMVANLSQRNVRSAIGTQAETSSTYPKRWVMPLKPSLPGSLFWRRVAARGVQCQVVGGVWR